jgi:hypothetical protein
LHASLRIVRFDRQQTLELRVAILLNDKNTIMLSKGARHEVKGFSFGPDRAIPSDGSTYAYAYRNNSGLCHFIAASPLPVDTRFEALARWTEDGREQERRWWFTTGRRTDTPLD